MSWFWKNKEEPCGGIVNTKESQNEIINDMVENIKRQQSTASLQREIDSLKSEQKKLHEKLYGDKSFYARVEKGFEWRFTTIARYDGERNSITVGDYKLSNEDAMKLAEFILDNLKE